MLLIVFNALEGLNFTVDIMDAFALYNYLICASEF